MFNPHISIFAIVSANAQVDKTACIYRGVKAKRVSIGAYTYVAAHTEIENARIGKFCSIADHWSYRHGSTYIEMSIYITTFYFKSEMVVKSCGQKSNVNDKPLEEKYGTDW